MIINLYFVKLRIEVDASSRSIHNAVKAILKKDGIVAAVREYRARTDSSLKDAVDYINTMLPEGQKIGQSGRK